MNDMSLHISGLYVSVEKRTILRDINLTFEPGMVHALLGPNGSGKSTLAYALAGHPRYIITEGTIRLNGDDITNMQPDQRARSGLFVAFQQLPAITGLTVFSFLKESYQAITESFVDSFSFKKLLDEKMVVLKVNPTLLMRSLYEGFSGGEKKRLQLLQLLLFNPKIVILDEIDSGVDIDLRKQVVEVLKEARRIMPTLTIILITHYQYIFKSIQPDYVHLLKEGKIVESGGYLLATQIEQCGYQYYK